MSTYDRLGRSDYFLTFTVVQSGQHKLVVAIQSNDRSFYVVTGDDQIYPGDDTRTDFLRFACEEFDRRVAADPAPEPLADKPEPLELPEVKP